VDSGAHYNPGLKTFNIPILRKRFGGKRQIGQRGQLCADLQ
jgi:hypothetical protein